MKFTLWSIWHFIYMPTPILAVIILYRITKRRSYDEKRRLGVALSALCVAMYILRDIEMFIESGFIVTYEIIPFAICHFANFVLLYAFVRDSKSALSFALLFNAPCAVLAIIFASTLAGYDNVISFKGLAFLLGHLLIVALPFWAFFAGLLRMEYATLKRTFFILLALYAASFAVNNLFGLLFGTRSNYFYSIWAEPKTPLTWWQIKSLEFTVGDFFFNPVYTLGTAVFGCIIMLLIFFSLRPLQRIFPEDFPLRRGKDAGAISDDF